MKRLLPVLMVFGVFLGSADNSIAQVGGGYLTGNQIKHLFRGSNVRTFGRCGYAGTHYYPRYCDNKFILRKDQKFFLRIRKQHGSGGHSASSNPSSSDDDYEHDTTGSWNIIEDKFCLSEDKGKEFFTVLFQHTKDRCFFVSRERFNFVFEDSRREKIWEVNVENSRLPETTEEQYASLPPPERTPENISADAQEELEALRKKIAELENQKAQQPEVDQNLKKQLKEREREIARLKEEKEKQYKPKKVVKKAPQPTPETATSGSGFFVSKLGHVITNQHVVSDCKRVTVGDNANKQVTASVIETDIRNDLALLKISNMKMASAETKTLVAKLGVKIVPLASQGLLRPDNVELGEDVVVAGFPFGDIFSNTIKITKGVVSAKRGMGNDSGQFQIDAAVQKGSSGGPIYDEKGNIIGVVVSQLNKLKVAKAIGSLPENVNFGIKASTVKQFLNTSGLPSSWSNRSKRMSTRDIAKIAENQTVMVMCHR